MADDRPLLHVVRGAPDPTELAALTAVLLALPTGAPPRRSAPSAWARSARAGRTTGIAGPERGGWRRSSLPR